MIRTTYDSIRGTGTIHEGQELHLWLTYRTPAVDGDWPLPQLSDHYNVFWDRKSRAKRGRKDYQGQ